MTATEPAEGAVIDGRYRLVECMSAAGAEHCSTWRACDEQLHRDVRLEFISAPADSADDLEVMLVSRCVSPSAVLDAGDWVSDENGDGRTVFLVTAFASPAARTTQVQARRRLFVRARVGLPHVTAKPA